MNSHLSRARATVIQDNRRRARMLACAARSWAVRVSCLLTTVFLESCKGVQSSLDPAGPQAGRISKLWWVMLAVCSAVFVLVMAVLFYSAGRARKRQNQAAEPQAERKM